MFGQHFYKRVLIIIAAIALMGASLVAQQKQDTPSGESSVPAVSTQENLAAPDETSPTEVDQVETVPAAPPADFKPYVAVVTADDVYVRSGPASIYYPVGKTVKGQEVIVRQVKYGKHNWAMIEPTPQCFSYIAKEFVRLQEPATATTDATPATDTSSQTTTKGIVTGNAVRVRAGSTRVPPANANQVQVLLNEGAIVNIIGEQDDFYKIVSPPDSYFWVSLDFVKQTGPVTEQQLAKAREQISRNISDDSFDSTGKSGPTSQQYMEYSKLMTMFAEEQNKPLKERNFEPIITALDKLITDTKTGIVNANAQRLRKNIARADEAQNALKFSLDQDQKLQLTLAKIDAEVQTLVAENSPPSKNDKDTVIKGRVARSAVFTAENQNRRYRILDNDGKTIYYAMTTTDTNINLEDWVGKNSCLSGEVKYDSFGNVRLLTVSGIVEVPEPKNDRVQ
jgi:hypothetical protein